MQRLRLFIIKLLSRIKISIRGRYKAIRKIQEITRAPGDELYHAFDRHIMVGNREIPVRVFEPHDLDPISSDIIEHINLNVRPQDIELPTDLKKQLVMENAGGVRNKLKDTIPGSFIFFHGGGWTTGNIDTYSKLCANIADMTGKTLMSVDYRLAPEHPYPAGLDDCRATVRQVLRFASESIEDISHFTLIGDSAGANLAAAVSLSARDRNELRCKRQILIYPATNSDFSDQTPFKSVIENGQDYLLTQDKLIDYMDLYAPTAAYKASPYVAPVLAEDLSDQPRTLIITADLDPLRDEGEYYGKRLAEAGNEVAVYRVLDALHGFFSAGSTSAEGLAVYRLILNFLEMEVPDWIENGSARASVVEILNNLGRPLYEHTETKEVVSIHETVTES